MTTFQFDQCFDDKRIIRKCQDEGLANTLRLPRTTTRAGKILAAFKRSFPEWHQTALTNSILEITLTSVEVWHVAAGHLVRDGFLPFAEADWISRFVALLRQNAERV